MSEFHTFHLHGHTWGRRFRGAAQLPPVDSGQPDLGYYCSLPLSDWAKEGAEA